MSVFVTGTDTGCGKTYISSAILRALGGDGLRVVGMKPVATGAEIIDGQLRNDDVEQLAAASNVAVAETARNPYLFEPPASPHIAAAAAGVVITTKTIIRAYRECAAAADFVVVEGVGGWHVPLCETQTVGGLAAALGLPVLLVVGIKLGCINHGLLSASAISASNAPLCGWIANVLEHDLYALDAVVATLETRISAPLLGVAGWQDDSPMQAAARLLAADLFDSDRVHRS